MCMYDHVCTVLCLTTWIAADSRVSCSQLLWIMSLWCDGLNSCQCHLSSGVVMVLHVCALRSSVFIALFIFSFNFLSLSQFIWKFRNTIWAMWLNFEISRDSYRAFVAILNGYVWRNLWIIQLSSAFMGRTEVDDNAKLCHMVTVNTLITITTI